MLNHQHEKEQFKKLFQNERIDRFDTRFKILEAFLSTEDHVTASDLGQLMEKRWEHPGTGIYQRHAETHVPFRFCPGPDLQQWKNKI